VTPDPGFKDTVVLKGEFLQSDAFYRHSYYRTALTGNHRHAIDRQASYTALQPHCSYLNRANFSQASRGFVSDSWPFLSTVCWVLLTAHYANAYAMYNLYPQACCTRYSYVTRTDRQDSIPGWYQLHTDWIHQSTYMQHTVMRSFHDSRRYYGTHCTPSVRLSVRPVLKPQIK